MARQSQGGWIVEKLLSGLKKLNGLASQFSEFADQVVEQLLVVLTVGGHTVLLASIAGVSAKGRLVYSLIDGLFSSSLSSGFFKYSASFS